MSLLFNLINGIIEVYRFIHISDVFHFRICCKYTNKFYNSQNHLTCLHKFLQYFKVCVRTRKKKPSILVLHLFH